MDRTHVSHEHNPIDLQGYRQIIMVGRMLGAALADRLRSVALV
jgi:hypothetical protein